MFYTKSWFHLEKVALEAVVAYGLLGISDVTAFYELWFVN